MDENNSSNKKGLIIVGVIILIAFAILTSVMVKFGKAIGKIVADAIHNSNGGQTINIFDRIDGDLIFEDTYNLEGIENVSLRTVAANITIKESSDNALKVMVYGKEELDVNVNKDEQDILVDFIDQEDEHTFILGINDVTNKMVVYLPKDYANKLNIDTKYGNIDFGIDLKDTVLDIESDYGNIDLKYIKDAKIECEFGNIQIEKVLNKLELQTSYGNIQINELNINEDSSITTEYGNVIIDNTNDIKIVTDVSFGEARVKNSKQDADVTLTITSQMGFIEVN